jgi:transcriptional regulator with XRE-family HTH domain
MSRQSQRLPIPVKRALAKLGEDIRNARRRRRIQTQVMAERASISRSTLHKVERGEAGVGMGIYATVLFVLGMLDRLSQIADATQDRMGMDLEEEILPQRIRYPKASRKARTIPP